MSSKTDSKRRCTATNSKGKPCKAWAMHDSDLCAAHSGRTAKNRQTHGSYARPAKSRPACGAKSRAACGRAKSRPASCCGGERPESRPRGKGFETIDDVIADALDKQARLSAILDDPTLDAHDLAKLLAIHGQNAGRLGRLLRDQRALSGESADGLLSALGTALDEIATELGITL